jgi:hypothetical protein
MPIPVAVTSLVYVADHDPDSETGDFVTFTFTLGVDPLSSRREPLVTVEIDLSWEVSSPHDPVTAELRLKQPGRVSRVSDDGGALWGVLSLQPASGGRLVILADVSYGHRDLHHLIGVLGILTPDRG